MTVEICGLTVEVDVSITPGRPETRPTMSDPGSPAEPPEVDYKAAWVVDAKGNRLCEFDINEYLSIVEAKEASRIDDEVLMQASE